MPLDDSSTPNKRSHYTPDPILDAISIASGNFIVTLTNPSDPSKDILLSYDDISTDHTITREILDVTWIKEDTDLGAIQVILIYIFY